MLQNNNLAKVPSLSPQLVKQQIPSMSSIQTRKEPEKAEEMNIQETARNLAPRETKTLMPSVPK